MAEAGASPAPRGTPSGVPFAWLAACFALSGACALVIETVWLRWFRVLFGATAPATSATVVAFLVGHALGAAFAIRAAPGWRRPLRSYGLLEALAAVGALTVPLLLQLGEAAITASYAALSDSPVLLTASRFAVALLATLPAGFAFGATLPAIGRAALAGRASLGRRGVQLYAWNTAGAGVGVALAAFWLPGAIGIPATYGGAVAGLVGVAGLAVWWGRRDVSATAPTPADDASAQPPSGRWLAFAAFSGFGSFAVQVLLVQAFAQVLNQSVFAFGSVLLVVLATLAAGAAVAALLRRWDVPAEQVLAGGLAAAGIGFAAIPGLLEWHTGLRYVGGAGGLAYVITCIGSVVLVAGPGLLAAALVYPASFGLARGSAGGVGASLARLTLVNTAGAVFGALAAPFLLLPGLGLWTAFAGVGAAYAIAALMVPLGGRPRMLRDGLLALGWLVVVGLRSPLAIPLVAATAGERVLFSESTAAGVVAVVERGGERLIRTDNHYALGGTAEIVHQERQGHLPLLLHPDAERVAFVGTATGISAGAARAHPAPERVLVEIVPAVARVAAGFFAAANRGVHRAPGTRVVVDDARNFMRATDLDFDVVVADLFVPWRAGTGSLYTREHFQAIRRHLRADGLFCQWLPLYQLSRQEFEIVAASFAAVFPRAALFRGDFYGRFPIVALVGWKGETATPAAIDSAVKRLAAAGEGDRWVTHPAGFWSLYVGPLASLPRGFPDAPLNSDAFPAIEFLAARGHAGGDTGKLEPFVGMGWARVAETLRQAASSDPVFPQRTQAMRDWSHAGSMLQAAGAAYVEGDGENAARLLAAASQKLPPQLVSRAPPDPTAAEVWRDDR